MYEEKIKELLNAKAAMELNIFVAQEELDGHKERIGSVISSLRLRRATILMKLSVYEELEKEEMIENVKEWAIEALNHLGKD